MPIIDTNKISKQVSDKYSIVSNAFRNVANMNPKDLLTVEIGDVKQPNFEPQLKVGRWGNSEEDNECNVSIRLVHDEKAPVITTEADKIKWTGDKVEAHFYDINNSEHPEGASEFEVILKEKPKKNVVEFTLVDKDVDYFYQPELTAEEIAQGSFRPENVVGSYAVYAKVPKTNWTDGKEYKCGKVGHIFRPKIIDSAGTEVWGDLHIENGILSVTIPQDFLDKAVYPVRHAAGLEFGYHTNGLSIENGGLSNYAIGVLSSVGESGTATSISGYKSHSGSYLIQYAIYDLSTPRNLKAGTGTTTIPSSVDWSSANVNTEGSFTAGDYFLCCTPQVSTVNNYYDAATGYYSKYQSGVICGNAWPNTLTLTSSWGSDYRYSIYATYGVTTHHLSLLGAGT